MKANMIDSSRIDAMVAQLKTAAAHAQGAASPLNGADVAGKADKPNFADALTASLNQVNSMQSRAEQLGKRFALGDDSVNLSDVMIAGQKANIAFQATVQVRNKLVSAYHDIMNMQV
ncbi:flagellar hook-basal body complex protein FliE [Oxalobacteraceae bacterium R-40]|uniref:Flagellar hook-basal body complex protein FliE n=1 Tax=Keguizhuia sedimenti TaxID=3064264 RepID=A0ABU1BPG7_9BURK|nr:flagellar hook-basal body complex protein FliE [Oxalobacteraceae bacterium R-40]